MPKKVPTRAVPPPLSPEARNFVLQGQPPPEPARPSVPPPPSAPAVTTPAHVAPAPAVSSRSRTRSGRTLISRVDGRTLRRLQIYLDADVAKRLKHHCVEHDIDMSAYVNEVLAKALR